jgi:hypothetical protein
MIFAFIKFWYCGNMMLLCIYSRFVTTLASISDISSSESLCWILTFSNFLLFFILFHFFLGLTMYSRLTVPCVLPASVWVLGSQCHHSVFCFFVSNDYFEAITDSHADIGNHRDSVYPLLSYPSGSFFCKYSSNIQREYQYCYM